MFIQDACDQYWTNFIEHTGKCLFVYVHLISNFVCVRAWHAMCFREINNAGSERACTVTDAKSYICGRLTVFAGMLISPLPQCLLSADVAE